MVPGLSMESEMRTYILHMIAKMLGISIKIDEVSVGARRLSAPGDSSPATR